MNSKFLFSIAALAMVMTSNAPAHAQYERRDINRQFSPRFNFAPQEIRPYGSQSRHQYVAPHQVTHGNVPRSSTFLTGVNPSMLTRTPPKPILVPETVISSGETFAQVQTPSMRAFRPEFGRPAVVPRLQPPVILPNYRPRPRLAQPAMLIASKPATTRQATPKPIARNSASRAARGTVLPRKQTPAPLIGAPQVANYNDTQLYAPGGVLVRSNGNAGSNVYGRVLSRSN